MWKKGVRIFGGMALLWIISFIVMHQVPIEFGVVLSEMVYSIFLGTAIALPVSFLIFCAVAPMESGNRIGRAVLVFFVIVLLMLFAILLAMLLLGSNAPDPEPPQPEMLKLKSYEINERFRLSDVFAFDWDRAYIVGLIGLYTDDEMTGDYYGLDMGDFEFDEPSDNRICLVFAQGEKCTGVFIYDWARTCEFSPHGGVVSREADEFVCGEEDGIPLFQSVSAEMTNFSWS